MTIKSINNKESFKLDTIDKKLFYYLSKDIRYPRNQLAKKLNISKERLNYRIERLLNNIIKPIILINYPLLEIKSYVIFIKEQLDKETIKEIENANETYLFTQCIGEYHHVLHIITNEIEKFMENNLPHISSKDIYEIKNYRPDNYNGYKIQQL